MVTVESAQRLQLRGTNNNSCYIPKLQVMIGDKWYNALEETIQNNTDWKKAKVSVFCTPIILNETAKQELESLQKMKTDGTHLNQDEIKKLAELEVAAAQERNKMVAMFLAANYKDELDRRRIAIYQTDARGYPMRKTLQTWMPFPTFVDNVRLIETEEEEVTGNIQFRNNMLFMEIDDSEHARPEE